MKKKGSTILFSVVLLTFLITTAGAVGAIPTSYNQDAQNILSMLWGKLDEAIVSNYNAKMLVRYHDHQGTNPGDFTTRGLPIEEGGIADKAISGDKVSDAVNTKVISFFVGDIAAGDGGETPIFIAPGNINITAVNYANWLDIIQNDTDYTRLRVDRRRNGGTSEIISDINTKTTESGGTQVQNSWKPVRVTSTLTNTLQIQGDILLFFKRDYGAGQPVDKMIVTVEYTADN
jgi:hypothetical protein